MSINFYTDGACNGEKVGGWAFYSPELDLRVCGQEKDSTNNRMELEAIKKVFEFILETQANVNEIIIHSDSAWAIGAISKDWKLKENVDRVNLIKELQSKLIPTVKFNKVKGHVGIPGNVVVDSLAVIMTNLK